MGLMDWLRSLTGAPATPAPPASRERERVDLRGTLPPDSYLFAQGGGEDLYSIDVVGESHYRDAIERAVGRRPEGHRTIVNAALVPERDNRHDPNAIAVQLNGQICGHFPRAEALAYRPLLERCQSIGMVAYARADVRGGWRDEAGNWADFGITVRLGGAEWLLARLDTGRKG
jgi:hypothetical protein